MNFFNPYQPNMFQSRINSENPQINPEQFKQALSRLDENKLNSLIQQAQYLGIPYNKIQEGLQYIQNMR